MTSVVMISFEEFSRFLSETLDISQEQLHANASFLNDLAIDSLKMVELVLRLEAWLGVTISPEALWDIQTVGDAYAYLSRQLSGTGA